MLAWKLFRCWVSEFTAVPELDANANAIAFEMIAAERGLRAGLRSGRADGALLRRARLADGTSDAHPVRRRAARRLGRRLGPHRLERSGPLLRLLADIDETASAGLGVGERDRLLMEAHELIFGTALRVVAGCPSCGVEHELTIQAEDLRRTSGGQDVDVDVDVGLPPPLPAAPGRRPGRSGSDGVAGGCSRAARLAICARGNQGRVARGQFGPAARDGGRGRGRAG